MTAAERVVPGVVMEEAFECLRHPADHKLGLGAVEVRTQRVEDTVMRFVSGFELEVEQQVVLDVVGDDRAPVALRPSEDDVVIDRAVATRPRGLAMTPPSAYVT